MTAKRYSYNHLGVIFDNTGYGINAMTTQEIVDCLNQLTEENVQLQKVIEEDEKLIQSTYDELTKLRCIKKNLRRIKNQWDWIMEAIQYD